jgi:hypothetical protein
MSRVQVNSVKPNVLQRACACGQQTTADGECEECRAKRGQTLQRAAVNGAPVSEVPPIVHEVLRSPGEPLDARTRAFMEPRFGVDFSGVRVHSDARAAESAAAVNAAAFTVGQDIVFGSGRYAPRKLSGVHLLAHELTHALQSRGGEDHGDNKADLEAEADQAASAIQDGVGPVTRVAGVAGPSEVLRKDKDGDEEHNPIASWIPAPDSILAIHADDRLFLVPGSGLVYVPSEAALRQGAGVPPRFDTDLGTLFEVPAAGASATRVFKAGARTAVILDAGSGQGVPAAVYLNQLNGVLANLGVSNASRVQPIHIDSDHVNQIVELATRLNVRAENLVIAQQFRNANRAMRQLDATFRATTDPALTRLGYGPGWQPPDVPKDKGGPGDIYRSRFTIGELVIEQVALRSALRNVSRDTDRASFLTKVTRTKDRASVVILGDLRGRDLEAIHLAMEAAQSGSWAELFQGVEVLSGFSHHAGRIEDRDVPGLMALLDATLLQTGRLRVVEQTSTTRFRQARSDTLEFLGRAGAEVAFTDQPTGGAGLSAAGASRSHVQTRGTDATVRQPATSQQAQALDRVAELRAAAETIETWRPWLVEVGQGAQVDPLLAEIRDSINQLRSALRPTIDTALRVRSGGQTTLAGQRDYTAATGGARGAAFESAVGALPATTAAETTITPEGFETLRKMRAVNSADLPLRVALHASLVRGVYTDTAYAYMLSTLDPATIKELTTGPRGGPSPRLKAFQRVRAEFNFRRSVLGSGEYLSIPSSWSGGAQVAGRVTGGLLLALEVWNAIGVPLIQAHEASTRRFTGENLLPFLRRLAFWDQAGVRPLAVGVDDPTFGSPTLVKGFQAVAARLASKDGNFDALYIEEPGLTDADVIRFGLWLGYHVRNFDEFAVLFIDSGQDAITWETPAGGDWEHATWKLRVGFYQTSGENHVEERWYSYPRLTEMMQRFVKSIIKNTETLLEHGSVGSSSPETEQSIGELQFPSGLRRQYRARLARPAATTRVKLDTLGDWQLRNTVDRDVTWWSEPDFWVYEVSGTGALVGGADYNTYAILRRQSNLRRQLVWSPVTTSETQETGNVYGLAWIPLDQLVRASGGSSGAKDESPSRPAQSGPRIQVGPLSPAPGSEADQSRQQGGAGIRIDF